MLIWGKREINTEFLWCSLYEKVHWVNRFRWDDNIKVGINEQAVKP